VSVSRALRRLLRIRELEEEQSRLALDSVQGQLAQLEGALTAAQERARLGRRLVSDSAWNGKLQDRLAGLEEARFAVRHAVALSDRIESAKIEVDELRQSFLARRVERRQSETLIKEAEASDHLEAERYGQQALDDGYRSRMFRGRRSAMRRTRKMGPSSGHQSKTPEGQSNARET
jgi:hypothetical protein